MRVRIFALAGGLLAALALATAGQAQETASVGIDTDVAGNTATFVGATELCKEAAAGEELDVDVIITDVADLSGFEFDLRYDPAVLEFVRSDDDFFVASLPDSNPLELAAGTEVSENVLKFAALDFGPPDTAYESGSGVLVRITFSALAAGISQLDFDLLYLTTREGEAAGAVQPSDPETGQYLGRILGASVAVDSTCEQPTDTPAPVTLSPTPAEETGQPGESGDGNGDSPTEGASPGETGGETGDDDDVNNGNGPVSESDDDDSNVLIWGIAAAVVLLLVGGGALFAWRIRRSGSPGA